MAIIKIHKKNRFVVVDNKLARNSKLTLKAKGLMLYLLSLPADREVTVKDLEKHLIEGFEAIRSAVTELIEEGYIDKHKYRDEKGLFQTEYTVYEYPQDINRDGLSDTDKPTRINRHGSSDTDNPISRSKESIKKKEPKISSSSLSEIKKEFEDIGLSGNETNELTKGIDGDEKFAIILEKIGLIKLMIGTGTVKNPVGYTIKSIKNINFNKPNILEKIEAEKRTQKEKKRKAEKLARIKEKEQYDKDMAMTEAELPKIHKVVADTLERLKHKRISSGGTK